MRPAWSAPPCLAALAALAACEPDAKVIPVEVNWMEWPAEVLAATPFTVRLSGFGPGCYIQAELRVPVDADASAVTFEPYWLVQAGRQQFCPVEGWLTGQRVGPVDPGFYDTRAPVPGLTAATPRSYEIRGAASVYAAGVLDRTNAALPVRTFGEVIVRSDSADGSHVNAGGKAFAYRDVNGCEWIQPFFISPGYVVENPPDTAAYWSGFLRGYVYAPPAPVCGETKVFHVVTFN